MAKAFYIDSDFLDIEKAFLRAPDVIQGHLDDAFEEVGELLTDHNRQNHPSWTNRQSNLQDDINSKYTQKKGLLEHGLGFNPKTKVRSKYGFFSYGVFQHEGTKRGDKVAIKGDQWIFRGFDQNEKKVEKEFNDAIKEGLKEIWQRT